MVVLNLAGNSICAAGGRYLLDAIKANGTIERVVLLQNSVDDKCIRGISERTQQNANDSRRRKIPVYRQQIETYMMDSRLFADVERKCEQISRETEQVRAEIESEAARFEEAKRCENALYLRAKQMHAQNIMEIASLNRKLVDFDRYAAGSKRESEAAVILMSKRLELVKGHIARAEATSKHTMWHIFLVEKEKTLITSIISNAKKKGAHSRKHVSKASEQLEKAAPQKRPAFVPAKAAMAGPAGKSRSATPDSATSNRPQRTKSRRTSRGSEDTRKRKATKPGTLAMLETRTIISCV